VRQLEKYVKARLLLYEQAGAWFPESRMALSEIIAILFHSSGHRCFSGIYNVGTVTGISFIDSTPIKACHCRRQAKPHGQPVGGPGRVQVSAVQAFHSDEGWKGACFDPRCAIELTDKIPV